MWIFLRINTLWQNVLNICHYDTCASESRPERVRLCVHTTEPTGPVPEPFHCDHIARWSARSGTTGRSGTGVNTGAQLRSGTVPVPKLWCEHGLSNMFQVYHLVQISSRYLLNYSALVLFNFQVKKVVGIPFTDWIVVFSISRTGSYRPTHRPYKKVYELDAKAYIDSYIEKKWQQCLKLKCCHLMWNRRVTNWK